MVRDDASKTSTKRWHWGTSIAELCSLLLKPAEELSKKLLALSVDVSLDVASSFSTWFGVSTADKLLSSFPLLPISRSLCGDMHIEE
jgi:hypothetical protein